MEEKNARTINLVLFFPLMCRRIVKAMAPIFVVTREKLAPDTLMVSFFENPIFYGLREGKFLLAIHVVHLIFGTQCIMAT